MARGKENQGGTQRGSRTSQENTSKKGLASADKETKGREAREGGKSNQGSGRSGEGSNQGGSRGK